MSVWTDLTLPSGSVAIHVSQSSGNDSNDGSIGSPVKTISHGYSLLRDGHSDQLLLKRGDTFTENITWTKSSGSSSSYMVFGAYGSGNRPKIRPSNDDVCIHGGSAGSVRTGLAIVDLDLAPGVVPTQFGYGAITFFEYWSHLLIEGCKISGFPTNIVIQAFVDGERLNDIKIRRNVIIDSECNSAAHSQGIFLGGIDNWLVEENVIDNNARAKMDIFSHNVYIHESNGPGDFIRNISSRACSHGVQQRPGGTMINNLYLQNPINAYQAKCDPAYGGVPADTNYCQYNVALDSRDINTEANRGQAFHLADAPNLICQYNVAAHQSTGTGNVIAYDLQDINDATISYNVSYDWRGPNNEGWATSMQWDGSGSGSIAVNHNQLYNPNHGMCVRHEGEAVGPRFTYSNNSYWSTNPFGGYQQFGTSSGVGGSFSFWQSQVTDAGSTFSNPGAFDVNISTYLDSIGVTGGTLDDFLTSARTLERNNWNSDYLAATVNDWVRNAFGLPTLGGNEIDLIASSSATSSVITAASLTHLLSASSAASSSINADAIIDNPDNILVSASSSVGANAGVQYNCNVPSSASSGFSTGMSVHYGVSAASSGASSLTATMDIEEEVDLSASIDCVSFATGTLDIETVREMLVRIMIEPLIHHENCWKDYNAAHRYWEDLIRLARSNVIIRESEVPDEPRVDDYSDLEC